MFAVSSAAIEASETTGSVIRTVLVVDDSRAQRILVANRLKGSGFTVIEAASGKEALEICATRDIDLILSDWIMPGMSGIEFCHKLRQMAQPKYTYFILLTSMTDKSAVAEGLQVGADDFLAKPVDTGELRARIKAGERLLRLERDLRRNNDTLVETLEALKKANAALDRDLDEARNLQLSLVRERTRPYPQGQVSLILRPSGHVGGDMVGVFDIGSDKTGLYNFDVSGHGVTSALLTARIAGLLSDASAQQNIAIDAGADGVLGRDPAWVASAMNQLMLREIQTERYLTLAYAEIDRVAGQVRFVQAGHPHPLVMDATGLCRALGTGGLPVGLIESAQYSCCSAQLVPGDRFILVSDGITECPNPAGVELGTEGLIEILSTYSNCRGRDLMDAILWELAHWHGSDDFPDDISLALYEHRAPPHATP